MWDRLRQLNGPVVFVIVTLVLTASSASLCMPAADQFQPNAHAMLRASVIYVAVVGWQPLVAYAIARRLFSDPISFDDGVRPVALRDSLFSVFVAVFVLFVAVVVETLASRADGVAPPELVDRLSLVRLARLVFAFVAIIAMLWLQAIIEELTWRGYVLPRLMQTLGAWPGLVVHGLVWGLCYSPLFALGGGSVLRSLGYVVTCGLLGVVLGWLRLATHSIYASAASNATLTICAGLPLLLIGEASRFSAAFEPTGWLPLIVMIVLIAWRQPWRTAIAVPLRRMPPRVR